MALLPKLTYRVNTVPVKIPASFFFAEMVEPILKFMWNYKGSQVAKTMLKRKNKVREFTLPGSKTYCKTTPIKTCATGIRVDIQINGMELTGQV